jgi:6-phosphogluconolactonase
MAADRMTTDSVAQSSTFATPEELARGVADWLLARALATDGRFAVCLTGGSTPKRLYELLATAPWLERFPWHRTHWFWGDERFVPHDDPQSNFHMAHEALLARAPIPADHIHAIQTDGISPAESAARYETTLKRFYGADVLRADRPLFDLTLLGLGEDGHIASLFPGSPALRETKRWVLPILGENPLDRITLTYPAIESSRAIAFLVTGDRKHEVMARLRGGDTTLPAGRLRTAGSIDWFTDRAASAVAALAKE